MKSFPAAVFALMISALTLYLGGESGEERLRAAVRKENSPIIDNRDGSYSGVIPAGYTRAGLYHCWMPRYLDLDIITFSDDISDEERKMIKQKLSENEVSDRYYYIATIGDDYFAEINLVEFLRIYFSRDPDIIVPAKDAMKYTRFESEKNCARINSKFFYRLDRGEREHTLYFNFM
jgi:hypothetical protein